MLLLVMLALLLGVLIGWSTRVNYSKDRYIQALAEKHEATARYWEAQTHDIITNNSLERNKRDGKKTN